MKYFMLLSALALVAIGFYGDIDAAIVTASVFACSAGIIMKVEERK